MVITGNQLKDMVYKTVQTAWDPKWYGKKIALYYYHGRYVVSTVSNAKKQGVSSKYALFNMDGGIPQYDLSSYRLQDLCKVMHVSYNQQQYLYKTMIANGGIQPGTPFNAVKVDSKVEAFIAAIFPDIINNFYYNFVFKTTVRQWLTVLEKTYGGKINVNN